MLPNQLAQSISLFTPFISFMFALTVILPSSRLTTPAIILFSIISKEPVPDKKNLPKKTENQLLHKTAPVLISTHYEKEIAGHCPRYFRANIFFEF